MEEQGELFVLIDDMVGDDEPNIDILEAATRNVQKAIEEHWTWAGFDPKESRDYHSIVAVALIDQARWYRSRPKGYLDPRDDEGGDIAA